MDELFKLYSDVRQPQMILDPKLDDSALLHYGYVVDFSKVLEYARQHHVFRDIENVDWENPTDSDLLKDEIRCMYLVVTHFSRKEKFPFNYAPVMGHDTLAHVISLYSSQQGFSFPRKTTMRLLTAIVRTFRVEPVPMWWWDAYSCGIGYKSNIALYNPMLSPPEPITPYARDRRIAEAQAAK
ncbi:hypothetical protein PENSPDRAFT_739538 [Peniophora sp. CONT]|nr:hypothetical protein PENSPDRAFT_739538 [Peniophora sp. CONT]